MSLALLGVFVMQLYYIRESYQLKSTLFEQDVNQALGAVVNKIQKRNVIRHIERNDIAFKEKKMRDIRRQTDSIVSFKVRFKESEALRKLKQQQEILDYLYTQDSIIQRNFYHPEIISEEDYAVLSNPSPNNNTLNYRINDIRSSDGRLLRRNVSPIYRRKKLVINPNNLPDSIIYLAFSPEDFMPKFIILPVMDPDLKAKFKLEDAKAEHRYRIELDRLYADTLDLYSAKNLNLVKDVAKEIERKDVPLERRIPGPDTLDVLLRNELRNKNIKLAYNYWVGRVKDQSKVIYRHVNYPQEQEQPSNTFKKVIFSNDLVISDPGMLYVSFPKKNTAILGNMVLLLASSAGLLLVLIFIFTYTIYAIIRQKKLSEMKTDFINNMTHEFKTPVTTIMIASEGLKDPDMVKDPARVNKLANIIYDENVRLGGHIERVLNVAKLNKNELKLKSEPIGVNALVAAVVDSMDLQLKKKNAKLVLLLEAAHDVVIGDEFHFSNVIFNLLDNANKYSLNEPLITIKTRNQGNNLLLEVADKGIGMTREQTKKVFDQFYRVPTGNLHDVKGFGLGLSYVNDVVSKMSGNIKVSSEKDKGTIFVVSIPLVKA